MVRIRKMSVPITLILLLWSPLLPLGVRAKPFTCTSTLLVFHNMDDIPSSLVLRQEIQLQENLPSVCGEDVDHGNRGLRIASIFILLAASLLGALLPIVSSRTTLFRMPRSIFFICKHVGTGVIIATAWMHLLSPAVATLHHECLASKLGDYDWAFAIGLMTVMVMFLLELMATSLGSRGFAISTKQVAPDSQPVGTVRV